MKLILCHKTNCNRVTRSKSSIKYIVIHYTGNDGDTAENNARYYNRTPNLKASAHFFFDKLGGVCSVPWYYVAWHCGGKKYPNSLGGAFYGQCTNYNSIGVELCSKIVDGVYMIPMETQKNAAAYVRELMQTFDIPIERVIRHYDVTGKLCPRPFVFDKAWEDFKKLITDGGNEEMTYYEKLTDIPAGEMRETVKKLVDAGVIKGNGKGLHLSYDMVRLIVFNNRAGTYKNI